MTQKPKGSADEIASGMAEWLQSLGGFGVGGDSEKRWKQFQQELGKAEREGINPHGNSVGQCSAIQAIRNRWVDGNLGLQLGKYRGSAMRAVMQAEKRHNCGG